MPTEQPPTPNAHAIERHRAAGALAIQSDQEFWTDHQKAALTQLGLGEASNGDLAVFLTYAQRTGLDPWARQIYMIARWDGRSQSDKYTIQASIDGLRIVAQRTGDYAGQVGPEWCGPDGVWRDVWLFDKAPAAARVGVLRRGWAQPQYAVALFREYAGTTKDGNPTKMWTEKPALMIAKCAEALALRKAFPQDLSGIYTGDEMSKADVVTSTVVQAPPTPQPVPTPPPAPRVDAEGFHALVYGARCKADLRAALAEADLFVAGQGFRRDVLEALTTFDAVGQAVDGWSLIVEVGGSLPDVAPAAEEVHEAELVEEDTAEREPSAGAERREQTPRPDPAKRHPAVSQAMPTVRAGAAKHTPENDEPSEEQL